MPSDFRKTEVPDKCHLFYHSIFFFKMALRENYFYKWTSRETISENGPEARREEYEGRGHLLGPKGSGAELAPVPAW
jgi:hypothetical protein